MNYKNGGGNKPQAYGSDGRYAKYNGPSDLQDYRKFVYKRTLEETQKKHYFSIIDLEALLERNNVQDNLFLSMHSFDRIKDRDVNYEDFKDCLLNPLDRTKIKFDELGLPSYKVIGKKCTVCINPNTGCIITIHDTHTKLRLKLEAKKNG